MKKECVICTEKYNESNRKEVKCQYCEFKACRECNEKYVLDETVVKCMNVDCNKEWTRKYMVSVFTKSFMNKKWKKHREKVLYDQQVALLPSTQEAALYRKDRDDISGELREIKKKIRELRRYETNLGLKLNMIDNGRYNRNSEVQSAFVRACPIEGCLGYLKHNWLCGLCKRLTCSKCYLVKDVDHKCDEDDVKTAELMKNNTKPCPKCSTGIFKIDGCDQMWCTNCHTGFSWVTGRIETNVHNPHYFEWMRLNGREANFGREEYYVCGEELTNRTWTILDGLMLNNGVPGEERKKMMYKIQSIMHLHGTGTHMRPRGIDEMNEELRVMYLLKYIDEKQFKERTQRENKKNEKDRECYGIIILMIRMFTEIIFRLIEEMDKIKNEGLNVDNNNVIASMIVMNKYNEEIDGLKEYVNECFGDIADTYGTQQKEIRFYNTIYGYEKILLEGERGGTIKRMSRDVIVNS